MAEPLERLRIHLKLIEDGVQPVVERYREHVQCRAGCSDCCSQSFTVTAIEGELLREGLAASEAREDILARARQWQTGQPCPVLSDDGRCRLYAHRPRICRKYGIPLWHPDRPNEVRTCPKNFVGVADIDPDLVLDPQAAWAEDWIALRDELALGDPQRAPIAEHLLYGSPRR